MRDHIRPHIHEAKIFWHFREHGLSPYWTLRNLVIHELDGYQELTTEIDGEPYHIRMNYSDSGIAPRPTDSVERDVLRDWELNIEGPGEAKCDYVIRARYDNMKGPNGESRNIPWPGGEGLDVYAQPSNIPLDDALRYLREALDALADHVGISLNPRYLREPASTSKISTVELYVRMYRQYANKIVRSEGIFHKIMHLLAPEKGTEWEYKGDNSEIVGHRHAFDLFPSALSKLGPWSLGGRAKNYHPKYVREDENNDDPLSSPKLGYAFHKSIDGDARFWDDREQILREIEEILINIMEWAGVPTEPDQTTFVEDKHFQVETSERKIGRHSDPTPQLEAEQETLLMRVLGDLSPSAQDITHEIATDGGQRYDDLANKTDNSVSTIYRALDQLGGIVESDRGMVKFTSEKIRQEIIGMVNRLDELKNSTADRVAELANIELRSTADSSVEKWMAKYGVDLVDFNGDGGTLRFDTILSKIKSTHHPHLETALREGMEAWESTGRDWRIFADLEIDAQLDWGSKVTGKVEDKITW